MSKITVVVLNIADEYDEAVGPLEEAIEASVSNDTFGRTYYVEVDDISTIDAIAEDWTNFVYSRPGFPKDEMFQLIATLNDEPDEAHSITLAAYRNLEATIVIACTEEQKSSSAFDEVWQLYELGSYDPWKRIAELARWRIIPKDQV